MKKSILAFLVVLFLVVSVWAGEKTLVWDANTEPDMAGYKVYQAEMISGTQTGPFQFITDVPSGVTTYTVTGLDDNKVYIFQVYAFDTTGNVSFPGSNVAFNLDRMAPGAVQNLK